jgi:hypothetical protein
MKIRLYLGTKERAVQNENGVFVGEHSYRLWGLRGLHKLPNGGLLLRPNWTIRTKQRFSIKPTTVLSS